MSLFALIQTAHAGIITEAPRMGEVLVNMFNSLLQFFGALAIIVFVVIGIKYFFSGGDTQSIEETKKWMGYAIIGGTVSLGAMILLNVIAGFFE